MADDLSKLVKIRELKASNTGGNYWVDIVWVSRMVKIQNSGYIKQMVLMELMKFRCYNWRRHFNTHWSPFHWSKVAGL
jgi:hypothetical protein